MSDEQPVQGEALALSEHERQRIRAEEIFRLEVRDQLNAQRRPNRKERIWKILNSAITLWALSTIAVGSITLIWSTVHNWIQESRESSAVIVKLDVELNDRIGRFNTEALSAISEVENQTESLVEAVETLNRTTESVWPDFEGRTTHSLLWEYTRHVKSKRELEFIRDARKAVEDLMAFARRAKGKEDDSQEASNLRHEVFKFLSQFSPWNDKRRETQEDALTDDAHEQQKEDVYGNSSG